MYDEDDLYGQIDALVATVSAVTAERDEQRKLYERAVYDLVELERRLGLYAKDLDGVNAVVSEVYDRAQALEVNVDGMAQVASDAIAQLREAASQSLDTIEGAVSREVEALDLDAIIERKLRDTLAQWLVRGMPPTVDPALSAEVEAPSTSAASAACNGAPIASHGFVRHLDPLIKAHLEVCPRLTGFGEMTLGQIKQVMAAGSTGLPIPPALMTPHFAVSDGVLALMKRLYVLVPAEPELRARAGRATARVDLWLWMPFAPVVSGCVVGCGLYQRQLESFMARSYSSPERCDVAPFASSIEVSLDPPGVTNRNLGAGEIYTLCPAGGAFVSGTNDKLRLKKPVFLKWDIVGGHLLPVSYYTRDCDGSPLLTVMLNADDGGVRQLEVDYAKPVAAARAVLLQPSWEFNLMLASMGAITTVKAGF